MTQELRKLAKATQLDCAWYDARSINQDIGNDEDAAFIAAANPAAILALLDRLEKAEKAMEQQKDEWLSWHAKREQLEKDAARLDWLEQNLFNRENVDWATGKVSKTHNMWVTFAPVGVQGSARRIIDSAMEASK